MIWDAARVANRRPLPKPRKVHAPVGCEADNVSADTDRVCRTCGHIWCSCKWVAPPYGKTNAGVPINFNSFMGRGHAVWMPDFNIQCGLLRQSELEKLRTFDSPAAELVEIL